MTADLDVIDMAATIIATQYRWAQHVRDHRATDPGAHPGYGPDLDPASVSVRAVGQLLAAGLLVTPATPAEVEAIRRRAGGGT